jgi:hypothetical protein
MGRLPWWPAEPWPSRHARDEGQDRPFTGFKLARAVLSADGRRAAFVGLTLGATRVYAAIGDAGCVWNSRHVPPRRWCGCGFYCLHDLADARALACATENRATLLLEVTASGRYIRYERGLRYSRQRVRAILDAQCGCGRAGTALADSGSGLIGWRHLAPTCEACAGGRPVRTVAEFASRLDGPVRVAPLLSAASAPGMPGAGTAPAPDAPDALPARESPLVVLSAEIALLHARLDDLQSRLGG